MRNIDPKKLETYVEKGLITKRKHPTLDLYIYNYTNKVQYEKLWDEYTTVMRGVILDKDYNLVEAPMGKFFNLGEHQMSETYPVVTDMTVLKEKMDGSLGIMYADSTTEGEYAIATRGSFTGPIAEKATAMLQKVIKKGFIPDAEGYTHMFEIIYPENRIIVDYGDREELVYLGSIPKENLNLNRKIILLDSFSAWFSVPETYTFNIEGDVTFKKNTEGYVFYHDGLQRYVKIKSNEYVHLSWILSGLTEKRIVKELEVFWSIDHLLSEDIPDEFYKWMKETSNNYLSAYENIKVNAEQFQRRANSLSGGDKKRFYEALVQHCRDKGLISIAVDLQYGKDPKKNIWRYIRKYLLPKGDQ